MHCAIKDVCQVLNGIHFFGTNFSKGCCGQWVHQGVGKVPNGFHGSISGGRFWHRILVREELNGLGCAFGKGLWNGQHRWCLGALPMYQPFTLCGAQVQRSSGASNTRTRVTGGARSVQLKSKILLSCASADSHGLICEGRRRFSVKVA